MMSLFSYILFRVHVNSVVLCNQLQYLSLQIIVYWKTEMYIMLVRTDQMVNRDASLKTRCVGTYYL